MSAWKAIGDVYQLGVSQVKERERESERRLFSSSANLLCVCVYSFLPCQMPKCSRDQVFKKTVGSLIVRVVTSRCRVHGWMDDTTWMCYHDVVTFTVHRSFLCYVCAWVLFEYVKVFPDSSFSTSRNFRKTKQYVTTRCNINAAENIITPSILSAMIAL